jgi:hypothetical protein
MFSLFSTFDKYNSLHLQEHVVSNKVVCFLSSVLPPFCSPFFAGTCQSYQFIIFLKVSNMLFLIFYLKMTQTLWFIFCLLVCSWHSGLSSVYLVTRFGREAGINILLLVWKKIYKCLLHSNVYIFLTDSLFFFVQVDILVLHVIQNGTQIVRLLPTLWLEIPYLESYIIFLC